MTASSGALDADVSELPSYGFGLRSPVIWGAALLVAIESTMMGLLLVSDVYLRGNLQSWPTLQFPRAVVTLAVVEVALLVLSLWPALAYQRAARREDLPKTRLWLIVATALAIAQLVARAFLVPRVPFRWDDHAFGSVFWTVLVIHTTHVLASVAENVVLGALFFAGPVEKKNFVDAEASWVLWAFTVIEWLPAAALLYRV